MYRRIRNNIGYGVAVMVLAAVLAIGQTARARQQSQTVAPGPSGAGALTAAQWRDDLDYFSKELTLRHAELFRKVSRDSYNAAVAALRAKIPAFDQYQAVSAFMELAAMFGDENTLVWPFQPTLGYHILPLQAYWFDDGVFLTSSDEEYLYVVGSRIAKIGGVDVEDVFELVSGVIAAENVFHKKSWFFIYGFCPEILYRYKLTRSLDAVTLTLVNLKNETYEVDVSAVPFAAYAKKFFLTPVENKFSPVVTNRRARNFSFRYIPSLRTIYVQLNEIRDQEGLESFEGFTSRLAAFADTTQFDRFVIDLRRRGGGSTYWAGRFADVISRHPKINRRGGLFTIVGRATAGTMLQLASMLEYRTKTVFVGEETGEGPNGTGESGMFKLPNSNIEVYVTRSYTVTSIPGDDRRMITPDVHAGYAYQDYLEGRDPAMAAVFSYRPGPPVEEAGREPAQRMVGRYLFSPYQILEIKYAGEGPAAGLMMTVTDFIDGSAFAVRSGLYPVSGIKYNTDIMGVEVNAVLEGDEPVDQLFLNWKGINKTIERADDGYLLPVELINLGRIEAGVTALLSDTANRGYYKRNTGAFLQSKGYALLEQGKLDDAIRIFRAGTEIHGDDPAAWIGLGDAFAAKDNKELARQFYQKSLELDPDNKTAASRLAGMR